MRRLERVQEAYESGILVTTRTEGKPSIKFESICLTVSRLDDRFSDLRNGRRSFRQGIVTRWKRKIKRSPCWKRDYRVLVPFVRSRSLRRER